LKDKAFDHRISQWGRWDGEGGMGNRKINRELL
jgi:hypothetical protein